MQQHILDRVDAVPFTDLLARDGPSAITLYSQDQPDTTADLEMHRWEDDGGAIVSECGSSLSHIALYQHVHAA